MELSIITINRNNADGLRKTMQSVTGQSNAQFEHLIIDGASTDSSVEVIKSFQDKRIRWISEPDKGIYNAMNKGIKMAEGDYIMILNSGDYLSHPEVIDQMSASLQKGGHPPIFYGNIIKIWPDGKTLLDRQLNDKQVSMFSFYRGTLNPDGTYIRRSLFEEYGYFNESMKICSDWAWFLKVVAQEGTPITHTDINTIYFDMTGISESDGKNQRTIRSERRAVLQAAMPPSILSDYDHYAEDIVLTQRLHRHPWAFRLVYFLERCLFKIEKIRK